MRRRDFISLIGGAAAIAVTIGIAGCFARAASGNEGKSALGPTIPT